MLYDKTHTQGFYYLYLQLSLGNYFLWLTITDMLPNNK